MMTDALPPLAVVDAAERTRSGGQQLLESAHDPSSAETSAIAALRASPMSGYSSRSNTSATVSMIRRACSWESRRCHLARASLIASTKGSSLSRHRAKTSRSSRFDAGSMAEFSPVCSSTVRSEVPVAPCRPHGHAALMTGRPTMPRRGHSRSRSRQTAAEPNCGLTPGTAGALGCRWFEACRALTGSERPARP